MNEQPDNRVWKSYVWHKADCYFVSTIERDYHTFCGPSRGQETIVWRYDYAKSERGEMIHQAGNIRDHAAICRCLILWGEIPDEDDERYQRFT